MRVRYSELCRHCLMQLQFSGNWESSSNGLELLCALFIEQRRKVAGKDSEVCEACVHLVHKGEVGGAASPRAPFGIKRVNKACGARSGER
jgi:hypothetical protein